MSEDRLERFGDYVAALAEVIGHADRVEPLRDYCRGLLLPGDRKSVEPIAAVTAPARGFQKKADTRSGWRVNIAASLASRTTAKWRSACRWPTMRQACRS